MDYDRFKRAMKLRDAGEVAAALEELEALERPPLDDGDHPTLFLNQANCLWRLGRLTEARQRWSEEAELLTGPFTEILDAWLCI